MEGQREDGDVACKGYMSRKDAIFQERADRERRCE